MAGVRDKVTAEEGPKSLGHSVLDVKVNFAELCLTVCKPMDCSLPGTSVHGDSPGKNTGVACHAFSRGSSQPRN